VFVIKIVYYHPKKIFVATNLQYSDCSLDVQLSELNFIYS
jgi:hypothetical protein